MVKTAKNKENVNEDTKSTNNTKKVDTKKNIKKEIRSKSASKNADKPQRARSAYILYGMDERPVIKKDMPDIAPKEIMSEIGKRWNALDEKAKKPWVELAAKEKETYEKELLKEKTSKANEKGKARKAVESPAPQKKGKAKKKEVEA